MKNKKILLQKFCWYILVFETTFTSNKFIWILFWKELFLKKKKSQNKIEEKVVWSKKKLIGYNTCASGATPLVVYIFWTSNFSGFWSYKKGRVFQSIQ